MPTGGTSAEGSGVKQGWNPTHGRPEASAATCAPQLLLSTMSASGRKASMAAVRSS